MKRNQPAQNYTRGDELNGGKVVGTSRGGVLWVSYNGDEDFREMCENFDRNYK